MLFFTFCGFGFENNDCLWTLKWGEKSVPKTSTQGLPQYAFRLAHVRDLIFNHAAENQSALTAFARLHRANSSPLVFPRQIHPAQVVSHAGLAAGSQPTSGAATPLLLPPLLPILYQQVGPALRNDQCLSPPRPNLRSLSSPHLLPTLLNARLDPVPRLQVLLPL